jgi:hypothetical protein
MPRTERGMFRLTLKRRPRAVIARLLRHAGILAEPSRFYRRISANKKLAFTGKISLP